MRTKIRLIEGNAKRHHLKKLICKKGLCGKCLSVWGAKYNTPLPSHPVYVYTVYLFTQERWEGGELNQREG
jgi:hypothetical protein